MTWVPIKIHMLTFIDLVAFNNSNQDRIINDLIRRRDKLAIGLMQMVFSCLIPVTPELNFHCKEPSVVEQLDRRSVEVGLGRELRRIAAETTNSSQSSDELFSSLSSAGFVHAAMVHHAVQ